MGRVGADAVEEVLLTTGCGDDSTLGLWCYRDRPAPAPGEATSDSTSAMRTKRFDGSSTPVVPSSNPSRAYRNTASRRLRGRPRGSPDRGRPDPLTAPLPFGKLHPIEESSLTARIRTTATVVTGAAFALLIAGCSGASTATTSGPAGEPQRGGTLVQAYNRCAVRGSRDVRDRNRLSPRARRSTARFSTTISRP